MRNRMKQEARAVAVLALAGLMALPMVATPAGAQTATEGQIRMEQGQITVQGEGRVENAPDMAVITLGVTTPGDSAAVALAANSAAIAQVLANLKAAGVADRDIQTTGLSISPDWQSDSFKSSSRIAGYIASNMVTVRVRALDTLGATLDAAVKDGANTLNGVEFALLDPAPALAEARRRAVADALAKAGLLAEAAGVKLGSIRAIHEGGGAQPPMPMMRMSADQAMGAVPVAAGALTTSAMVTIVWDLAG